MVQRSTINCFEPVGITTSCASDYLPVADGYLAKFGESMRSIILVKAAREGFVKQDGSYEMHSHIEGRDNYYSL